jgi:hypothetical protein
MPPAASFKKLGKFDRAGFMDKAELVLKVPEWPSHRSESGCLSSS